MDDRLTRRVAWAAGVAAVALAVGVAAGVRAGARAWAGPPDGLVPLVIARSVVDAPIPTDRPLIVHVWSVSCPACRIEVPVLERLARTVAVPIVGLSVGDEAADIVRWLDRYGNPYAATFVDADGKVAAAIDVRVLPATFVLGAGRRVLGRLDGPLTPERLESVLLPLLATGNSHAPSAPY